MSFDEMQFGQLLLEANLEQAARQLIEMAKIDPKIGMALIDFIFEPDDDANDTAAANEPTDDEPPPDAPDAKPGDVQSN